MEEITVNILPSKRPADWTVDDVAKWLLASGLQEYVDVICIREKLDGSGLLDLSPNNIRRYLAPLGDASKMERLLDELRLKNSGTSLLSERCDSLNSSVSLPTSPLLYPREIFKAMMSACYFLLSGIFAAFFIAVADERAAKVLSEDPLQDVVFDYVNIIPATFAATEKIGMLLCATLFIIFILHRHRLILLRRVLCLMATVMILRSFTIIATTLPAPNKLLAERCRKRHIQVQEFNWLAITYKTFEIFLGLGLQVGNVTTCSDLVFSGHTSSITLFCLFITHYSPESFVWFHRFVWLMSVAGISCIIISHEHYTVDVLIALYLVPMLFLYYHSLANSELSRDSDSSRVRYWFPLFSYFESNCSGVVPNQYELPNFRALLRWRRSKKKAKISASRSGSQLS